MAVVEAVPFPDVEGNRDDYELLGWDMEPGDWSCSTPAWSTAGPATSPPTGT